MINDETRGSFSNAPTWRSVLVAGLVFLAGLAALACHRSLPLLPEVRHTPLPFLYHWDSQSYLFMAQGNYSDVASPFSKRALYPWMAASLARATNLPLPAAFLLLNLIAFALLAYCLAAALEITTGKPWLTLLLLLTPLPLESLELGYLPDLFHMGLTALFFLLLLRERVGLALVVLMVSFATRESTLLLCLTSAIIAFFRRQRALMTGSLVVLVLGAVLTSLFARLGKPNLHHLPDLLYLALKVPFNFLLNILGLCIWTDVNHLGQPLVKWPVPSFLHKLITDREFGLFWDWRFPADTALFFLTVFGTAPAFAARFFNQRHLLRQTPLVIQLAFLYGIACYFLGPTLGGWVQRLIGYGWPAFWIALPWLLQRFYPPFTPRQALWLGANFLTLAWWPTLCPSSGDGAYLWRALGLFLYVPTLLTLANARKRTRAHSPETAD